MLDGDRLREIEAACRRAPCLTAMGFQLVEADAGTVRLTAPHDPRFDGLLPGFHGGMLAMVADCAAWYAIATLTGPSEPLVTTDLFLRYLNPCLGGVTAAARVLKFGRTLCPVQVELSDSNGAAVATGIVTYMRLQQTPAEA